LYACALPQPWGHGGAIFRLANEIHDPVAAKFVILAAKLHRTTYGRAPAAVLLSAALLVGFVFALIHLFS
jgi:hypothetical protein